MRAGIVPLLIVLGLLGACADAPKSLRIAPLPEGGRDGSWPVWPKGAEVPRFVYVGDLTGEENFQDPAAERSRGVLAWLIGLGQEQREPVVLRRPQGVAEGADGRIWVSDVSRQAVFVFDTVGGELRVLEYASDSIRFVSPVGLAPLADGDMLVADAELGYVVRFSADGVVKGILGKGHLVRPTGIAVDQANGRIYVADTRSNAVQTFDLDGRPLFRFGHEGQGAGQLNAPTYLAMANGRLFVTDTLNARIQVFDSTGAYLTQFGQRGLYVGNLTRPKGVSVSDEGLVFVVESYYDYLLVFDSDGRFLLPIGGAGHGPGEFFLPAGVWAGRGGRVYIADMFNGRVEVFQFLGGTL